MDDMRCLIATVILISKRLKCHSKAERRAPAYSQTASNKRVVHKRYMSGSQIGIEGRVAVEAGVVWGKGGKTKDRVSQGMSL